VKSGIVKFFNPEGGYGFIRPADGSRNTFIHITDAQRAGPREPKAGWLGFEIAADKQSDTYAPVE
jgi:CspA family cold shock protein